MDVEIELLKVDISATNQDPHKNTVHDLTVHYKITSDFGPLVIEVPIVGVRSLDTAVQASRSRLANWAHALSEEAQTRR